MELKVDIDNKLQKYLDAVITSLEQKKIEAVTRAAEYLKGVVVDTIQSSGFENPTGALARDYKVRLITKSSRYPIAKAGVFSDLPYAGVQDRDYTTIKAKSVKNLAIPLRKANKSIWPRDRRDLTFLISKKGNKILAKVTGKGKNKKITPEYLLKPSVAIRGVNYLQRSLDKAEKEITRIIGEQVQIVLDNAEGER